MKEDLKKHNLNWPKTPDHPYGILIIRSSESGKTNAFTNVLNHVPDIDKITKITKHQLLINKRESTGLKSLNDSKVFIEYWNNMDGIYKIIEEYNPNKKRKVLIVLDDMIADMPFNKKT